LKTRTQNKSIFGLLLIGGKSTRMGTDKSELDYHGKPQWIYNTELFEGLVDKFFISVRKGQKVDYPNLIEDKYEDLGPFGAILTAIETYPDTAFLVFATDIPFLNKPNLEFLISKRNPEYSATVFQGKNKEYPEPLACIWEPEMLEKLKECFEKQKYSLTKILKQSHIQIIEIEEEYIQNINTYEEYLNCKKQH
jgi:molybdopterin-guanine dinucleotide biosynthesis protein A